MAAGWLATTADLTGAATTGAETGTGEATTAGLFGTEPETGNCGTLLSTGAGGDDFKLGFEPPTDEDEAGDGGSYNNGTTTDFCVGSRLAFSKLALGADWPACSDGLAEPLAGWPLIGTGTP